MFGSCATSWLASFYLAGIPEMLGCFSSLTDLPSAERFGAAASASYGSGKGIPRSGTWPIRKQSSISSPMDDGMACIAKRYEVLLCIMPGLATEFPMVNLEVRHRAATLTPPSVPA